MAMLGIIMGVFAFGGLIVLPGALLMHAILGRRSVLETVILSVTCGVVSVGVLSLSAALLLRIHVTPALLGVSALGVAVASLSALRLHRGSIPSALRPLVTASEAGSGDRMAAMAGVALLLVSACNFFDPGVEDACVSRVVLEAVRIPEGAAGASMNLIDQLTGQRFGTTALIAPFVSLYGCRGFAVFYVMLQCLVAGYVFLLVRRVLDRPRIAFIVAIVAVLNPYVFKITAAEENVMSFALVSAALFLAVSRPASPALVGLFAGAAIGIRHVNLALLPALAFYMWNQGPDGARIRAGRLLLLVAFACAGTLPCLIHHKAAYGSFLSHEHFFDEVFYTTPHRFLGWEFQYTGLLNFPFYDKIIRTPFNPFPTFLYYPLSLITHLGVLLSAAVFVGVLGLWHRHRRLLMALVVWSAPIGALLCVIEDWMDPCKMNIAVSLFPFVMVALGAGLERLLSSRRSLVFWALIVVAVVIGARFARRLDFPADPRAYEMYERMHSEHPYYPELERLRFTRANLLPDFSRAFESGIRLKLEMLHQRLLCRGDGGGSVVLSLDLAAPIVKNCGFLCVAPKDEDAPDLREEGIKVHCTGIPLAWTDRPAELLAKKERGDIYWVRLRFGDMPFGDFFEIVPPGTVEQYPAQEEAQPARFSIRVPDRAIVIVTETVNSHDTLMYMWMYSVCNGRLRNLFFAEKMLHT